MAIRGGIYWRIPHRITRKRPRKKHADPLYANHDLPKDDGTEGIIQITFHDHNNPEEVEFLPIGSIWRLDDNYM